MTHSTSPLLLPYLVHHLTTSASAPVKLRHPLPGGPTQARPPSAPVLTFTDCAGPETVESGTAVTGGDAFLGLAALVVLSLTRAVVSHNAGVDSG